MQFLFLCVALVASWANADSTMSTPARVSGRIYSTLYAPARNMRASELQQSGVGFWLESAPRFSEESSAKISLAGDLRNYSKTRRESFVTSGEASSTGLAMELREAYALYATNSLDLRIGRQIIPWGKSDVFNPTDVLGAKDQTFFHSDEEMKRLGAFTTLLSWTPSDGVSPWNFTGVWLPVFSPYKLLIPRSVIPSAANVIAAEQPRVSLEDTEIASRIAYTGEGWDFSLMGFKGWSHLPEFREKSRSISVAGVTATVAPSFYEMSVFGGDLSFTLSDVIFRAESAYKTHYTNNDPVTMPSYWESVAGVEKKFLNDFRFQLQGLYRQLSKSPGNPTDAISKVIAQANQRLLGYQSQKRKGVTARIQYDDPDVAWKAELFVLAYDSKDYFYRPKVSYQWSDAFDVAIGGDQYGGPKESPLGSLVEFNSVFFETRYLF